MKRAFFATAAVFAALLLSMPAFAGIELHHIFPREYAQWFHIRGINPDLYCIPLTRERHTGALKGIHHHRYAVSGGLDYNKSWYWFIRRDVEASKKKCFAFAGLLLGEFGISLVKEKFYDYGTRAPSGKELPKGQGLRKVLLSIGILAERGGGAVARIAPYLMAAYVGLVTGGEFDDHVDMESFDMAIRKIAETDGKEGRELLEKISAAYYFFGMAFYGDVIRSVKDAVAEIAAGVDSDRKKKLEFAAKFFGRATEINDKIGDVFPDGSLRLGLTLLLLGKKDEARWHLEKAARESHDAGMASTINDILGGLR